MKRNAGFTLIEIMMTLAIISILAVLSINTLSDTSDEARFETTLRQMKEIRNAILGDPELKNGTHRTSYGYLGDLGSIPNAAQGISALLTNPGLTGWALNSSVRLGMGWNGPYLNASTFSSTDYTKDAWGTAYIYSPTASPPTLVSLGADRAAGGTGFNADITLLLPAALTTSKIHGVILNAGIAFTSTAQLEFNSPDGSGNLVQTLQNIVPADNGAFTINNVAMGIRSATVYIPNKISSTSTYGPYPIEVNQADTLAVINLGSASPCSPAQTFSYTGANQNITVPTGCSHAVVKAWGAGGGGATAQTGGGGAYAYGIVTVTSGETLTVAVGGGGSYDSVTAFSGGGGGASSLSRTGTALIIAGGGGGAGAFKVSGGGNGGAGGGLTGLNGSDDAIPQCLGGGGGSQIAGGAFGAGGISGMAGNAGASLIGGAGSGNMAGVASSGGFGGGGNAGIDGGGGGGGGYFGGGGGGGDYNNSNDSAGGGGGSSFVPAGGSALSGAGQNPANMADSDRGTAGVGGAAASNGSAGTLVISWQ